MIPGTHTCEVKLDEQAGTRAIHAMLMATQVYGEVTGLTDLQMTVVMQQVLGIMLGVNGVYLETTKPLDEVLPTLVGNYMANLGGNEGGVQ